MANWLMKSEPGSYSWENLVRERCAGAELVDQRVERPAAALEPARLAGDDGVSRNRPAGRGRRRGRRRRRPHHRLHDLKVGNLLRQGLARTTHGKQ